MRILPACIMVLAVTTAALAGGKADKSCVRLAQLQTARPMAAPPNAQIDRLAICHQERGRIEVSIRTLRSQIAAAKTQLSQMSGLSFHCVDNQTSANNKGMTEYCSPNACLPETGRCANEIRSSADCASGYVWDSSTGNCVNPAAYTSD
jgi:hypothetical protein